MSQLGYLLEKCKLFGAPLESLRIDERHDKGGALQLYARNSRKEEAVAWWHGNWGDAYETACMVLIEWAGWDAEA